MRNWATKGYLGRTLWRGAGALGRGSFDARGLPGARTALGVLGGDVITGSRVDIGEASKKNFKESSDARIAWREKEAAALKPSDNQLSTSLKGVLKKLTTGDRQRLLDAANHHAEMKEKQKNGEVAAGDVKAAKRLYDDTVKDLKTTDGVKLKEAIKAARIKVGSENAKIYATSITTLGLHNAFGATSGVPFWIGKADKEAAAKIRESSVESQRVKNVLVSMGGTPEEIPEATRVPLTRQAMQQTAQQTNSLEGSTERLVKSMDKLASKLTTSQSTNQTEMMRSELKAMRGLNQQNEKGFSALKSAIRGLGEQSTSNSQAQNKIFEQRSKVLRESLIKATRDGNSKLAADLNRQQSQLIAESHKSLKQDGTNEQKKNE